MPVKASKHIQTRRGENVRIGPITIITLIIVVCMAVMGVLAASTANATSTISQRQANATKYLYDNERAAQEFVACVDDVLARVRASGGTANEGAVAVTDGLDAICERARSAADGEVSCTASVDGTEVMAEFSCGEMRLLNVTLVIQRDVSYRIGQWKSTSAQPDGQTGGNLWTG